MSLNNYIKAAERLLTLNRIPPSEEIISLIKKVNPTSLNLSESDKEQGYNLKGKLQNLLLENYGDSFFLVPDPSDENKVLIKHRKLPSIDACHADINRLSVKSLDTIGDSDSSPQQTSTGKRGPLGDVPFYLGTSGGRSFLFGDLWGTFLSI